MELEGFQIKLPYLGPHLLIICLQAVRSKKSSMSKGLLKKQNCTRTLNSVLYFLVFEILNCEPFYILQYIIISKSVCSSIKD